MLKKLKQILPDKEKLRKNKLLHNVFGSRLFDPQLWYFNRNNISMGLGCGFFIGYLPIPMQMAVVAVLGLLFRFNLPAALAVGWISKPLTWVALYFPAYKLGSGILGQQDIPPAKVGVKWFMAHYPSLLLGCFIIGLIGGILCIICTRLLWRLHIIRRMREKKNRILRKNG